MVNIILYLAVILSFNQTKNIINSSHFIKDKKIILSAQELNNLIESNKNLKTIYSKEIRKILKKNKVYSYKILAFSYLKDSDEIFNELNIFLSLNSKNYNKIGYFLGKKYLTIILVNELVKMEISPVKKSYKRYQYIKIKGKTPKNKIKSFSLYINTPSNKIKKLFLPIIDNKFSLKYKLKENGVYIFEIISDNDNDPKIISKLSVIVGKNEKNLHCNPKINNKNELLKDINRIRRNNGLNKVKELSKLSQASYQHSKDMAENNFFSHLSSKKENPSQRLKNSGIRFEKILENISQASKLCLAHNDILESPGHLNNLLDREINKIGLGIYQKNGLIYLTEDFILFNKILSLKESKLVFLKELANKNINNNNFLNRIAKTKNYNEYYLASNIPKKMPIYISGFKAIKSYFFIINEVTPGLINDLQDINFYEYYGYNISKFRLKEKTYLFLTIILANL